MGSNGSINSELIVGSVTGETAGRTGKRRYFQRQPWNGGHAGTFDLAPNGNRFDSLRFLSRAARAAIPVSLCSVPRLVFLLNQRWNLGCQPGVLASRILLERGTAANRKCVDNQRDLAFSYGTRE
jgi:hypothetical protein